MSEGKTLVCDLPENERNDLITLFNQYKLTGQIMTMTKEEAERLINDAMNGKKTEPETKKDETVTETENKQDNKEVKPKPQKTVMKQPEPDLPKCPRCYSPVKGRKCSTCGFKF